MSACTFVLQVAWPDLSTQRSLLRKSSGPGAVGFPLRSQCEKGAVSPAITVFPWLWSTPAALLSSFLYIAGDTSLPSLYWGLRKLL